MKRFAFLAAALVGIACLPASSFIHAKKSVLAGARQQSAQPKKASVDNPLLELEIKHEFGVTAIAYSPDRKLLAVGADDYTVQLWDAQTGKVVRRLNEPGQVRPSRFSLDGQRVYSLAFSPDGKTLASGGDLIENDWLTGGQATLWEVSSGRLLQTMIVNREITAYTNSVAFTPDGKNLVTGMTRYVASGSAGSRTEEGDVSEWNALTGGLERKWKPLDAGVHSVAFSPDGQSLVTGSSDGVIKFWDYKTGKLLRTLSESIYRLFSFSHSLDGKTLASCIGPGLPGFAGSIDALLKVHLFDLKTGQHSLMPVDHSRQITAVAFSPDGQHLASGDEGTFSSSSKLHMDGAVKIWRIR
jgi:WD40 repeat protein